jgi:hypothetical protein
MSDTLVGTEGGRWIVTTEGSTHHFDLDNMTVIRVPGPHAAPTVNDIRRQIRCIVQCTVGIRGFWTMEAEPEDGGFIDHFWHLSSRILRIDAAPPDSTDEADI